ncbi:DUF4783 domain-containing protein [Pedobacter insulae]|uniref:DUF4783 domain-containing protein n=1 Tax=Pedobacter insulae TaxID=414048 RepID=A0A1I2U8Z3_9SPHI|nr:DUF4783 domain-containing protein [Pedobacter insulae]SFG73634.1 protein of unknown function [Pedobacter insulae]
MKSLLFVFMLFFQFITNSAPQADIVDELAVHFKNGNSKEIAKNFSSSIELLIIDQEDVYSKAQSEQILKDFFSKNTPSKIAIIHRLNSNPNYRYGIFSLQTKTLKYRVTVTLMRQKTTNVFLITELRIEKD